jgi:hypothetical protein
LSNIEFKIMDRSILDVNEGTIKQALAYLNNKPNLTDEQKIKAYNELTKEAQASLRIENVNRLVQTKMIGMDFFQLQTLAPDEQPGFRLEDPRPNVPVTVVSEYGGSAQTIGSSNGDYTPFRLGLIESDRYRVKKWDLYQGFVNNNAWLNKAISDSIANQLDDMAWTAIAAGIGALDANTWILDPKIKNAPTTNLLNIAAECNGKLSKTFFKAISQHFDRVGKQIRVVYIPSARRGDLYDFVSVSDALTPASTTVTQNVQDQIWNTGSISGALIPPMVFSNVLEGETPGQIVAYAIAVDAPGYFFQKPDFHVTDEEDKGAWHYAQTTITGSFVIPAYRRMNVAKIIFG